MIYIYIIIILIVLFMLYHLVWYLLFKRKFIPVLMYHRVTDDDKPKDIRYQMHKGKMLDLDTMKVKPHVFDKQIAYLSKKGYIAGTLNKKSLEKESKKVYITFDDGYYDNYDKAFPILNKYNFKATFFLTVGLIEEKTYMPIDLNDMRIQNRLMDWPEIREMAKVGMQLGGHTLNHNWLTNDGINLEEEIEDSKIFIEEKTGYPVTVFAYPAGMYNDKVLELVKEFYECAVITSRGIDFPYSNKDPYLIERETISSKDSMFMFKLKVSGVHRFLRKLPWVNFLKRGIRWIFKH